jgi:molybdate transport system substrate-binding protein
VTKRPGKPGTTGARGTQGTTGTRAWGQRGWLSKLLYPSYPAYLGYLACLTTVAGCAAEPRPAAPVTIFAAASLKTALDALMTPCGASSGVQFRASYAASSTLAKQIEEGAQADVFISADLDWMDYVATRKLIQPETRINLLGNRLVLIAPRARPVTLAIEPGFALAKALGDGRLAVADPASVPAGKYARAALTSLGVWESVAARLAPADNVRAALVLVSRAEAPLGIVYRSDAIADASVVPVGTFPESTHPPIVYPAAVTSRAIASAAKVFACLRGPEARAEFERQGFSVLDQAAPAPPGR